MVPKFWAGGAMNLNHFDKKFQPVQTQLPVYVLQGLSFSLRQHEVKKYSS